MSAVDLVILGFVKKKPLSAYDLAKIIDRTEMARWLKLGLPTVYQNLRKMEGRGYLSAEEREGESAPPKTVYTITAKGEAHWRALMERYSSTPGGIFFDFNAFVVNVGLLDRPSRLVLLGNLRRHLAEQRDGVARSLERANANGQSAGRPLMEQYERVYGVLVAWIEDYIAEQEGQ